ncbi:MAG: phosphopantetheine-binding protein, partial [Gammaproteobacteria bacterium]
RYRADGNIEFIGRTDHQVKIRGFRIELGEIEAKISEHPAVEEAVVLSCASASGDKRLIAYVVSDKECSQQLRDFLLAKLPAYMVPSQFIRLEQFPLSANGKVDRKSLPEPCTAEVSSSDYTPPETKTETLLAEVWRELLGVRRIGRYDDFFEAGGHSLLATQLQFKIQQAFPVKLSLKALFENPNIAAQARLIDGEGLDDDNAFLEAEAELAADIVPLAGDVIKIKDSESLLLTFCCFCFS